MFFIAECAKVLRFRRRSRMMQILTVTTLWIVFCYIKDIVFLFEELKESAYVEDLVSIIDIMGIPIVCAFFVEASMPRTMPRHALVISVCLQAVFLPAYIIMPDQIWMQAAFFFAALLSTAAYIVIIINTRRYRRAILSNLSYTENIDVVWVRVTAIIYFIYFFVYRIIFIEPDWIWEAVFNALTILLWTFLYYFSMRQRVLRIFNKKFAKKGLSRKRQLTKRNSEQDTEEADPNAASTNTEEGIFALDDEIDIIDDETQNTDSSGNDEESAKTETEELEMPANLMTADKMDYFDKSLRIVMEEQKLFLQPKLTLHDVAKSINSNKSYLSFYLHNVRKTTFYDFINQYRIEEACRLMNETDASKKYVLTQIATLSGFNSISTFNRYFYKMKGVHPSKYKETWVKTS